MFKHLLCIWALVLFVEETIVSRTSWLADAIAVEDILAESNAFRSGRPPLQFK